MPILLWGHLLLGLKNAVEIGKIMKSGTSPDLPDLQSGIFQQSACMIDPQLIDPLFECDPEMRFIEPAEPFRSQMELFGDLTRRNIRRIIFLNVIFFRFRSFPSNSA